MFPSIRKAAGALIFVFKVEYVFSICNLDECNFAINVICLDYFY